MWWHKNGRVTKSDDIERSVDGISIYEYHFTGKIYGWEDEKIDKKISKTDLKFSLQSLNFLRNHIDKKITKIYPKKEILY